MRSLLDWHLAAMALRDDAAAPPSRRILFALGAIHLIGIAAFWRLEHQPIWLAFPTLALLLTFPILTRRTLALETLAPFFFLYAIIAARYVAIRILFAREPYVDEASLADPRLVFFQLEVAAVVSVAYVGMAQLARYVRADLRSRVWVGAFGLVLVAALGWFAAEAIGHRTRGVTASDPYAYAQMAVDLVTRGTVLHSFPLIREIANEKIPWYPIQHIGYRLFDNLSGDAPTVWPIGGSIWIAAFYRILGEEGLYLATPIAAILSLVVFAFLVWEYFRFDSAVTRGAVTAIGVALLATSWEMVDRSIVPLVDPEAQLFTILAVLFTLRAGETAAPLNLLRSQAERGDANSSRSGGINGGADAGNSKRYILFGILTGVSLAVAYLVRHTQVLLAIPILLGGIRIRGQNRYTFLIAAALTAISLGIPDLYYHHLYFGGWLTPESNELSLFSLSYVTSSAAALGERFFAGNEFGYLIPFLLYGIYRAARDDASKFSVIGTWILTLVVFHLPYLAIKMRDVLPEFPAVILLTAYGMYGIARDLRARLFSRETPDRQEPIGTDRETVRATGDIHIGQLSLQLFVPVAILMTLLLPAMRTRLTILRPFQPAKITFGYVTSAQRTAFDQIAALTPPTAVIASVMNDGPIDMYAHRATFRPGFWTSAERDTFIAAMKRTGRDIFLLEDGAEMSAAKQDLGTRYALKPVATMDVPLFGETESKDAILWELH